MLIFVYTHKLRTSRRVYNFVSKRVVPMKEISLKANEIKAFNTIVDLMEELAV